MPLSLLPDIIADAVTEITPQMLRDKNIQLLMMDFDNTIVPYTTDTPTQQLLKWLNVMRECDIALCVVSNSKRERVKRFCKKYGLPCITHAGKPGSKGIRLCLETFGVAPDRAALVGDQIYTDTLGGNSAGVTTFLVKSIHNHTFWLKARHVLEMPFIFAARKRRLRS